MHMVSHPNKEAMREARVASWRALASSSLPTLIPALALTHYALARATRLPLANHDVGWFLHAGAVWLDGGAIGDDIIDTNPPLVIWLSGLEVGLARGLGLTPFVVHAGVTSALVLGSVLLSCAALLRSPLPRSAVDLFRPLAIGTSVLAAGYHFGQRDHWVALLLMPYATWAFARESHLTRERMARIAAGACAGLAVCLKPHHGGALVAVELMRWLGTRSVRSLLRAESVIGAGVTLLYVASLPWLATSWLEGLGDTLALYSAYDNFVPWWSVHGAWLLAALAAGVALRVGRRECGTPLALALVAAAGFFAARIQQKNFPYHFIPSDLFAFGTLGLAFGIALARTLAARPAARAVLPFALALAALVGIELDLAVRWQFSARERERDFLDRHAAGEGVLVFTTAVGAAFPILNFSRARSVSPYSCLWPIPGNYAPAERVARPFRYRDWLEMTRLERNLVLRLTDVVAQERPRLLVFDVSPYKQGFGDTDFQFLPYLSAYSSFGALLRQYDPLVARGSLLYFRRRDE
jgi:hypothetical protein